MAKSVGIDTTTINSPIIGNQRLFHPSFFRTELLRTERASGYHHYIYFNHIPPAEDQGMTTTVPSVRLPFLWRVRPSPAKKPLFYNANPPTDAMRDCPYYRRHFFNYLILLPQHPKPPQKTGNFAVTHATRPLPCLESSAEFHARSG